MSIVRLGLLMALAAALSGCMSGADRETLKASWKANPQLRRDAIARCVERTKTMTPEARRQARQIMRVGSDERMAPLLCQRLGDALVEGRIELRDLSWTDGVSTQSPQLVRIMQGR